MRQQSCPPHYSTESKNSPITPQDSILYVMFLFSCSTCGALFTVSPSVSPSEERFYPSFPKASLPAFFSLIARIETSNYNHTVMREVFTNVITYFLIKFYIIRLLFPLTGIATCWLLVGMNVKRTYALALLFKLECVSFFYIQSVALFDFVFQIHLLGTQLVAVVCEIFPNYFVFLFIVCPHETSLDRSPVPSSKRCRLSAVSEALTT